MELQSSHLAAVGIGIGATLVMDGWNLFLKRAFGIPSLSYCLLGRWLGHMADGTFRHRSIAAAARKSFECPIGWVAHYGIGLVFALGFVRLAPAGWLNRPAMGPPLLFGLATMVFPWFVMQPAFGLGIASSRAPDPTRARLKSLASHLVFGLGMYLSAVGLGFLARGGT